MEEEFDAIVVGAGFGGSACAALLSRRGLKTLLLEKNAVAGGKAMTMSKEGFGYEFWPVVGGPSLHSQFHAVLKELDMEDEVELLTPPRIGALLYGGSSGHYEMPPSRTEDQEEEGALALVKQLGLTAEELCFTHMSSPRGKGTRTHSRSARDSAASRNGFRSCAWESKLSAMSTPPGRSSPTRGSRKSR